MTAKELADARQNAWYAVCYALSREEYEDALYVHDCLLAWWKQAREAERSKSQ